MSLVLLQLFAQGVTVDRFQGGASEAVAGKDIPGVSAVVNITVPAGYNVLNATMIVSSVLGSYPAVPELLINGSPVWAFNKTYCGALGKQDCFLNGKKEWTIPFGASGGTNSSYIRLPKGASVANATLDFCVSGPARLGELMTITGKVAFDWLGSTVSSAGDVNKDGFSDMIVGSPNIDAGGTNSGGASIYLGGQVLDKNPYISFKGAEGNSLGAAVSYAGDINKDGYDDVLVGASGNANCAYIFYGGPTMDSTPDVTLAGNPGDYFGDELSDAGDVNNDGYDDVIVGLPYNDTGGTDAGCARIYFGGPGMDSTPEVNLYGTGKLDNFGYSVSGAGDVNSDGYDDVVVGSPWNASGGSNAGRACIFFGGQSMDSIPDVTITGAEMWYCIGCSVSGAGDVNSDGYDDVIVGAFYAKSSGQAFILFGGPSMDNNPDVTLTGEAESDNFGYSVSGAGDVNNDGYDDVTVGSRQSDAGGKNSGKVDIFYGGQVMDNKSDISQAGAAAEDGFGEAVSGAGDVNKDGRCEIMVGAPRNDAAGTTAGCVSIYGYAKGLLNPNITLCSVSVWNNQGYINQTNRTGDSSEVINGFLASAAGSVTDGFQNVFVDVPVCVGANSTGNLTLSNLSITYLYDAAVPDFSATINSYISAHGNEKDAGGNLTVPLTFRSATQGTVRLSAPRIICDGPPVLSGGIPVMVMDEDTANTALVDLWVCFEDEYTPGSALVFYILNATNSSVVSLGISGNRYLTADALTGASNDNWTGTVEFGIGCRDIHGLGVVSSPLQLIVTNVNDAPLVTSTPGLNAKAGVEYQYQVEAVDGDNDAVSYTLVDIPVNLGISSGGKISWTPPAAGDFGVSVAVSDQHATSYQNFSIKVTTEGGTSNNRLPRFSSTPVTTAVLGVLCTYDANATDDDNDPIVYSVSTDAINMSIDPVTGVLTWMPSATGTYNVSISVTDGKGRVSQGFVITVTNQMPWFTSVPLCLAAVGEQYVYDARATGAGGQAVGYNLVEAPPGMSIVTSTGKVTWMPNISQVGQCRVTIRVYDLFGMTAEQDFSITVYERPRCTIISPTAGSEFPTRLVARGTASGGTPAIALVQVRLDGGSWQAATGTDGWSVVLASGTKAGPHTMDARAFDGTRYSDIESVKFTIYDDRNISSQGTSLPIIALIALAGIALGVFLYMRMGKSK